MTGRVAADPREPEPSADESLLAELLAQLADDVQHGRPSRLAELEQAHPRVAGELRALFAAVQIAEGIAHFSGSRDGEQQVGTQRIAARAPPSGVLFALPRVLGDFELLE